MTDIKNIRGIIFDLDGTLYHMKWFMRPLMFLRIAPSGSLLLEYMKVRKPYAGKDFGGGEQLMDSIVESFAKKQGLSAEKIRKWVDRSFYPSFIYSLRFLRKSRPGLNEWLLHLRRQDIRLAVLSDFGKVPERLEALKIKTELFDTIASAEELGALKPHTRPFKEILDQWHLTPAEVLVAGDRKDTDGVAAASLGMPFVQISDKSNSPESLFSWQALKQLFEG